MSLSHATGSVPHRDGSNTLKRSALVHRDSPHANLHMRQVPVTLYCCETQPCSFLCTGIPQLLDTLW